MFPRVFCVCHVVFSFLTTLLQLVVLVFHAFYAVCVVWGTWLVYIILCSLGRQPHTTNGVRLLMILCFDFQVVGSSVSSHVLFVVRRCNKSNIYIYRHGNTKWALKFQSAVILHHGKQIKKRRDVSLVPSMSATKIHQIIFEMTCAILEEACLMSGFCQRW